VKEKSIYISASIKGFFKKGKSDLVFHSGDVHEMNVLIDLDLEEHCVGNYFKSNRDQILRFFVNENGYVHERIKHFVIRDIVTEEIVFVDDLSLIPFTGRILLKTSKPINITPIHSDNRNIMQQNVGCFGGVRNVVGSPFRTIANNNFSNPIPVTTVKPMNEILALALGCILLLVIVGSFLRIIGLPLYLSFFIPGLILLSIFIHGLIKTLPFLEQNMSIISIHRAWY